MKASSWRERFDLSGQVALVTGAAGQLGRQFLLTLGQAGSHVVVADLELARCEAACQELTAESIKATPLSIDVADHTSVRSAFESTAVQCGRLDILVNNAGIAVFAPFEERPF